MSGQTWLPKGLTRAVRDAAAGTGWQAWSGSLSRVEGPIAFHVYEFAGQAWFLAKPVAWSEMLWRAVGWSDQAKRSASFHFRGISVPVPALSMADLVGADAEAVSGELVTFAEAAFEGFDDDFDFGFPALMKLDLRHRRPSDFVITEIIWHLCEGRRDRALKVADAVVSGARRPSFTLGTENGSVFEQVRRAILNGAI